MSTKITSLKINNFLGIQSADIEFKKPVSLFVGENNQGKSSIVDAIEFGYTGKCRYAKQFNQAGLLAHNGQPDMSVSIIDQEDDDAKTNGTVARTSKTASSGCGDSPVLSCVLNPPSFIAMPPKDRCRLISGVLGGAESVITKAIGQHVGNIPDRILKEVKSGNVDPLDVDALRGAIVDIRRDFKRQLKAIPDQAPIAGDYESDVDFLADDAAVEIGVLAQQIANSGDLLARARTMVDTKAKIHDIKADIKKLKKARQDVPILAPGDDQSKISSTSVIVAMLESMLEKKKQGKVICTVCTKTLAVDRVEQRFNTLATWLKQYSGKIETREAVQAFNATIDRDIELNEKLLKTLTDGLQKVDIPKGGETLLADLTAERDTLQVNVNNHERFTHDVEVFESLIEGKTELEVLIKECNRIDEALKDGGPVKIAIAAGGKQLPINAKLLEVWNMPTLEWSDNGEIALNGRPIECASESERYRAGCVLALALSSVADVGFAALDGFEVLVGDNANLFFGAVDECGLNNVFVFASTIKDYSEVDTSESNMEIFEVVGGKVTKLA